MLDENLLIIGSAFFVVILVVLFLLKSKTAPEGKGISSRSKRS